LALCNKQAAAAGFASGFVDTYESSGSMGTLASGSTKLDPEKANTYTLGLIWQPRSPTPWLSGLRLALDGWWIRVKGAINNRDANVVVNGCYNLQG
ncbi:TonB-dependent receptor domain-containing protein, partial [Klebsiella pneumoniae]|uniref:TonB-dependent receptor domain-containing protein n=1 Tax=Klebsiella pneumoniae TaxID=573 RepID=UPI003EE09740